MHKEFRLLARFCGLSLLLLFVSGCTLSAPQPEEPYPGRIVISEPEAGQEVAYNLDGIGQIQFEFDHAAYDFSRADNDLVMGGSQGQRLVFADYFSRSPDAYADFFTLWGDLIRGKDFFAAWDADLTTGQ